MNNNMIPKKEDFWVKLAHCPEIIDMASTPARLYILIAQIQLALRHPDNVGASADICPEDITNPAYRKFSAVAQNP